MSYLTNTVKLLVGDIILNRSLTRSFTVAVRELMYGPCSITQMTVMHTGFGLSEHVSRLEQRLERQRQRYSSSHDVVQKGPFVVQQLLRVSNQLMASMP